MGRRGLFILAVMMLAGCVRFPIDPPHAGSPEEAAAIADSWLAAVSGDDPGAGWSLIHPLAQERLFGNEKARYVAEVEEIDWANFGWDLARPATWDGNYLVMFAVEGDLEPIGALGRGRLIQLIETSGGSTEAAIVVRIDERAKGVFGP